MPGLTWEEAGAEAVSELERSRRLDQSTVVLIGSMARETATEKSDIDILIVTPDSLPRLKGSPRAQIVRITRSDFVNRLKCGDDFPQWAVRYGKVISDESHWREEVQRDPALDDWPDWRRKRDQARERLRFATPLRESGDLEHAREELLLAVRHLARAILLKERVFPLSQPELPAQLREIDQSKIAGLLDSLIDDDAREAALEEAERAIIRTMEELPA